MYLCVSVCVSKFVCECVWVGGCAYEWVCLCACACVCVFVYVFLFVVVSLCSFVGMSMCLFLCCGI